MLTRVELPKTDQSTDGDLTDTRLHETAQRLEQSVVEGWEMISGVDREDSMRLDITPVTTTADPSEEDEWANLFGKLQDDVARLSRLTLQIKLALAVIKDEVCLDFLCSHRVSSLLTTRQTNRKKFSTYETSNTSPNRECREVAGALSMELSTSHQISISV